jgi:polyhydroxyalkanoate synthesis regulator phasin
MATEANIKLPDDLLEQAQRATRNGETADQLAEEAVRREIDRRKKESVRPLLAQIRREAIRNRGGMTDEQAQDYVDQVIHEDHAETRGR